MPGFNTDRWKTADSYEIPWRSLRGNVNQEGRVRGYLQAAEDQDIVEWDDHATVTDVDVEGQMTTYEDIDWEMQDPTRKAARHILVEGVGSNGEEIVFFKRIGSFYSDSNFYLDGKKISAQKFIRRHATMLDPFGEASNISADFIPGTDPFYF